MRFLDTDDYMTKLDLIDTHPNLFIPRPDFQTLNKREIEHLRIIVNGKRKLYKMRKQMFRDGTHVDIHK